MDRPSNHTTAWSLKYLLLLVYFTYSHTFYFVEARPTGSKVPCSDGSRHIHLVLGADNHLVPRWTFLRACDPSERALLVETEDHLISSGDLGANSEHRILELNLEEHPALRCGTRDKVKHQALVPDTRNHLVPMCSAIRYGDGTGKAPSLDVGDQLVPSRKDIGGEAGEVSLLYTVLDTDNHLVKQQTAIRRNEARHQMFILDKDSHIIPLRHVIRRDQPGNEGCDGTEEFLVLNSFGHLVPVQEPMHHCDATKEVHLLNAESHLVSRRLVVRRGETGGALFLDADSYLVPLRNGFRDGVDISRTKDQPVPLRRMIRRAEFGDDAPTPASELIESGMQKGNHETSF